MSHVKFKLTSRTCFNGFNCSQALYFICVIEYNQYVVRTYFHKPFNLIMFYFSAFALTASIASIIWGCGNYIYSIFVSSNDVFNWRSLLLQLLWNFSMLLSRISSIVLFTIVFGIWTLIPLGKNKSVIFY